MTKRSRWLEIVSITRTPGENEVTVTFRVRRTFSLWKVYLKLVRKSFIIPWYKWPWVLWVITKHWWHNYEREVGSDV